MEVFFFFSYRLFNLNTTFEKPVRTLTQKVKDYHSRRCPLVAEEWEELQRSTSGVDGRESDLLSSASEVTGV